MWFWILLFLAFGCGVFALYFGWSAWVEGQYTGTGALGSLVINAFLCLVSSLVSIAFGIWAYYIK
jgi:hypothetical protein